MYATKDRGCSVGQKTPTTHYWECVSNEVATERKFYPVFVVFNCSPDTCKNTHLPHLLIYVSALLHTAFCIAVINLHI